ncbi:hypothetical protein G6O69_33250 [Pseudenhygromyxa sp. WMMC2535]|uniref:hypothetical protein n=1 Tax=Pseudenhygromyxa sp. WMMC2535 TaxID=2712867 RepID=UPI001554B2D8|nr:hypothetical protein [Pseudenhygromyxa sp. WMMC2535]NVB42736.1 hypothetical protein [Pseudenhygromyxa sp. WMMC2535]
MLDADEEVAALYEAYVEALREVLAEVEPWWQGLREKAQSAKALRERWPCGVASHPRVLAVYLEHHRNLELLLARRRGAPVPVASFDDDAAWGIEAEPAPETLIPFEPHELLVDRLQIEAPALFERMLFLLLRPVGDEPDPSPTVDSLGGRAAAAVMGARSARWPQSFMLEHRHGVDRGVARLLAAPGDLRRERLPSTPRATCSEAHAMAHQAYHDALEPALVQAAQWWTQICFAAEDRGLSPEEARAACFERHFAGPAAHPRVVGLIRAYWRLCEDINNLLPAEQRVDPEQLLLGWLVDEPHESWVEILSAMPYWPVARDGEGRWV